MCLIFQDRFWVMHIPFIHMVKFQLLVQFPLLLLLLLFTGLILLLLSLSVFNGLSFFNNAMIVKLTTIVESSLFNSYYTEV